MMRLAFPLLCLLLLSYGQLYASPRPLKIGLISGLSGAAAKWNRFQNMGITLAQEDHRKESWEVEIISEDSKTNPAKAIAAFEKLIAFDKVDAIIADDFGFVLAPLIPRINQNKKIFIAISLPHQRYCNESEGYLFSISSQFSLTKNAFDRFFQLQPSVKRIAFIAFDDPEWGNTYLEIWKALAHARKIEIVETYLSSDLTPDFKPVLTKLLLKQPDAIFIAHEPESFAKARTQLGYRGEIVSANNVLEMLADSSNPRPELEGTYIVDPQISPDFRNRFKARFGLEPILEAFAGYEALRALAQAFKNNPSHPELGMKMVKYEGIAGPIDFSSSCVGNYARWGLFRFKDGQLIPQ